jgi:hypothetical protein
MLTIHLHLMHRLRIRGNIPPLPHAFIRSIFASLMPSFSFCTYYYHFPPMFSSVIFLPSFSSIFLLLFLSSSLLTYKYYFLISSLPTPLSVPPTHFVSRLLPTSSPPSPPHLHSSLSLLFSIISLSFLLLSLWSIGHPWNALFHFSFLI